MNFFYRILGKGAVFHTYQGALKEYVNIDQNLCKRILLILKVDYNLGFLRWFSTQIPFYVLIL